MSTRYDLYCRTCGEEAGFWDVYNRPKHLLEIWKAREAFAKAEAVEPWLDTPVKLANGSVFATMPSGFFHWCSEHQTHDVTVRDEGGKFWDRCDKLITCTECGTHRDCVLEKGHDGPCED